MSEWHREHPELAGTDADPWMAIPSHRAAVNELRAAGHIQLEEDLTPADEPHPRNTVGCCDGSGQVHHGEGALHFVTLCQDAACKVRRAEAWARECGEDVPR